MLTIKIGDKQIRLPVWPMRPGGLTGLDAVADLARADRSDRSMQSPSTIKNFYRFRSVKRISCGVRPPQPINIKGHSRLRISNRSKTYFLPFYLFSFALTFPIYYLLFLFRLYVDWGRSRWSADPRTTLRVPARRVLPGERSVVRRWFTLANTGLTGPYHRSNRSALEVLQWAPHRAARLSAFVCWP